MPTDSTLKRLHAFTLIELMIAIAIAAILLSLAAPSFQDMIIRSRIETLQDRFANAVITARTEASSRGQTLWICPLKADGEPAYEDGDCDGDWADGWAVFALDADNDPQLVARFLNPHAYPATLKLASNNAAVTHLRFSASGFPVNGQASIFALCNSGTAATHARGVMVEPSGRIAMTQGTESIHKAYFHQAGENGSRDAQGSAKSLSCS